jgi:hypothetical protein
MTLADLANPNVTIGHVDGVESSRRLLEQISHKYGKQAPKTLAVANYAAALRMIVADRLNYCIGPQVSLQSAAVQTSLTGQVFDVGTLYTIQATPIVNVKHRELVAPLRRELQAVIAKRGVIVAQ